MKYGFKVNTLENGYIMKTGSYNAAVSIGFLVVGSRIPNSYIVCWFLARS